MSSDEVVVRARKLEWSVGGRPVLGSLDLEVRRGEVVAAVGPNGAGKSTLLRLLSGLVEPTGGSLEWPGADRGSISRRELARRVAYLPQDRDPEIPLTVERFVILARYAQWTRRVPSETDRALAGDALDRLGLGELAQRSLGTLSGGEQQLVHIAASIAQGAPLWLLDEPTNHLDPKRQREVVRWLRELDLGDRSTRPAIIVATHDLGVAAAIADRVVAMSRGRIAAEGPVTEVIRPEVLQRLYGAPFFVHEREGARHVGVDLS